MRRSVPMSFALLAIGCGRTEQPPAQEGSMGVTPATAFAGTWDVKAMSPSNDSVLISYELNATSTSEGWTSTLPGREPMPLRVVLTDGDSVVTEAGPYQSALRPGEMVRTRSVYRLDGNNLTGTIAAHYDTGDADSLMTGRVHGERKSP